MTDQQELHRVLDLFLADGTDELADRVIDAALDQIDHTRQRRATRMPRRLETMNTLTRLAAAAVIGALAIGTTFALFQRGQPAVSGPGPSAVVSPSPSQPAPTLAPTVNPTPSTQAALTGPMGEGRQIQTATRLKDGRVLIAGGYALGDGSLAVAALYDPTTNAFSPTGSLADARGYHTATLLSDGRVLITGGGPAGWLPANQGPYLASAEVYDPTTGTFNPTGSMATSREVHTATRLLDGRVLIVGGMESQGRSVASAELYDPKTGTFSPTGPLKNARAFHTATLLSDGRVLIAGGSQAAWTTGSPLRSAEIYDPATGTFSETGQMTAARTFHAATLLADHRVLLTGGNNGYQDNLTSAEIYDPATGRFTLTGSMTDGREYQTATLLSDGGVLVAAGGGDYTNLRFLSSAEIFDPKAGTFTATGSLTDPRTYHAATVLVDGRVLVTGGYGAVAPLASAEIYDPTTGAFSPAGTGG